MNNVMVLYVGDAAWPEFRHVHSWLMEHTHLTTAAELASAVEIVEQNGAELELVVLAERWPGEFSSAAIDRLRRAAPLVRVSELLGTWCERTTRSSDLPAGTLREFWHRWLARMAPEFAKAADGECPAWGLPATATDEERLLALESPPWPSNDRGLLAIRSSCAESAAAVAAAAARRGFATVRIHRKPALHVTGIRAIFWVIGSDVERDAAELREWQVTSFEVPIIAIVSFPRVDVCDRLLAAGASVIVSQPFWLDDLFGPLDRLLDENRRAVR